ncbi:MAG TPA: HD domain-containing protein [Burkholderiales bacterium]|jgi:putative hydrolase of HD superfamily
MQAEIAKQFAFLREIDQLKSVMRRSPLIDRSRRENSAEHSWHLAMYAVILASYANEPVALGRVVQMLLVHDIVEIDAGDTPIHDAAGQADQGEREAAAAQRLFGMLPEAQGREMHALWTEFEAGASADARFAKALDRLQPLIQNIAAGGGTWNEFAVSHEQVLERYGPAIEGGAAELWCEAKALVQRHFDHVG